MIDRKQLWRELKLKTNSVKYIEFNLALNALSRVRMTLDGFLNWILDLLITYTRNS
jgi:hypothetical protein